MATESLRPLNEGCERIAEKALVSESGEVSVGKVSMVEPGEVDFRLEWVEESVLGLRASSATARLPWEGWERMRAIPEP